MASSPSDHRPDHNQRGRRARASQGAAWKRRSVRPGAERRPTLTGPVRVGLNTWWVGAKKRNSKSNKETGMKEVEGVVQNICLTSKAPYKACSAFTRVTACTLALSPIRDTLIEGFSHFVASMTAPIASGWSGCRVGLAPTGKRRLVTAHTHSGHADHPDECPAKAGFIGAINAQEMAAALSRCSLIKFVARCAETQSVDERSIRIGCGQGSRPVTIAEVLAA